MDSNLEETLNLDDGIIVDFQHNTGDVIVGDSLESNEHVSLPVKMEFGNIETRPIFMETETIMAGSEEFTLQLPADMPVIGGEEEVFSHEAIDTIMNNAINNNSNVHVEALVSQPSQQCKEIIIERKNPSKSSDKKYIMMTKHMISSSQNITQNVRSKEIPIAPKPTLTFIGGKTFSLPVQRTLVPSNQGGKTSLLAQNKIKRPIKLVPTPPNQQTLKLVSNSGIQYMKDEKGQIFAAKKVGDKQVLTKVSDSLGELNTKVQSHAVFAKVVANPDIQSPRLISIQNTDGTQTVRKKFIMQKISPKSSPNKIVKSIPQMVSVASPTKLQTINTNTAKKIVIAPQNVHVVRQPLKRQQLSSETLQISVGGKVQLIRLMNNSTASVVKPALGANNQGNYVLKAPTTQAVVNQGKTVYINKIAPKPTITKIVKIAPPRSGIPTNLLQSINQKSTGQSLLLQQLQKPPSPEPTENVAEISTELCEPVEEKVAEDVKEMVVEEEEVVAKNENIEYIGDKTSLAKANEMNIENDQSVATNETNQSEELVQQFDDRAVEISLPGKQEVESESENEDYQSKMPEFTMDTASNSEDRQEDTSAEYDSPNDDKHGDLLEHLMPISDNYARNAMKTSRAYTDAEPTLLSQYTHSKQEELNRQMKMRSRRRCNCHKSQCLKLYCDCFASGEFCNGCNCYGCYNNLEHEEMRQRAIRGCLERNPKAFRPKIGKAKDGGPVPQRQHTKGCNCRRSGCLKNYCECFEAKIACSAMCRCIGCRNLEDTTKSNAPARSKSIMYPEQPIRPACSFLTSEVIEAVCGCMIAAGGELTPGASRADTNAAVAVLRELSRCLRDVISASSRARPQILAT